MSISVLNIRTIGIKNLVLSHLRERTSEIAIVAIVVTIIVGVAALAAGDIMEAVARSGRR